MNKMTLTLAAMAFAFSTNAQAAQLPARTIALGENVFSGTLSGTCVAFPRFFDCNAGVDGQDNLRLDVPAGIDISGATIETRSSGPAGVQFTVRLTNTPVDVPGNGFVTAPNLFAFGGGPTLDLVIFASDSSSAGDFVSDYTITLFGVEGAPAVPEPATWAMMIGGFGMIGGAMRRRTRGHVAFS